MFLPILFLAGVSAASAATLEVEIVPRFNGAPLVFDSVTNTTAAGQIISVTRLDFFVSNFALRRADGIWIGRTNWFAYISAREGRTTFQLDEIPTDRYEAVRFSVGGPPDVNKSDPAQYAPEHPLNPNVNGLHWGWQGGYVFMAIEGDWQERRAPPRRVSNESNASQRAVPEAGAPSGYSFHIANDPQLMTVELPLALELNSDYSLRLALDVARIFAARHRIALAEKASATHSRANDPLAAQLHENIERAFLMESLVRSERGVHAASASVGQATLIASNATPYRLTISALFPRPALPLDNPLTEEGVALGRALFNDTRLSINNSQSCASCHDLRRAGVDQRGALSGGAEGKSGTRNAMPLFNLAWKNSFFWDGRAATLREQVLQPIQNPIEMHETLTNVVAKLQAPRRSRREEALTSKSAIRKPQAAIVQSLLTSAPTDEDDYPSLFTAAFGSPEITADRIARALEQFLLTQISHDSKFDRVLAGQDEFTAEEQRGFELFHTENDPRREQFGADCFHCHGGPLFQSQTFANNGLDAESKDLGRYEVTKRNGDQGRFAVPSLRNVAVTGPYMHDGRFKTLEEVVAHYSTGVKRSATLDPNLAKHPDGGVRLNDDDKRALVAFLKTLTDVRFESSIKAIAQAP